MTDGVFNITHRFKKEELSIFCSIVIFQNISNTFLYRSNAETVVDSKLTYISKLPYFLIQFCIVFIIFIAIVVIIYTYSCSCL